MKFYNPESGFFEETETSVEITDEYYIELLNGQSQGMRIISATDGHPVLTEREPPSEESLIKQAENKKTVLLAQADLAIAPLARAVKLGMATAGESSLLEEWERYSVLVNRVDTKKPVWPEIPV